MSVRSLLTQLIHAFTGVGLCSKEDPQEGWEDLAIRRALQSWIFRFAGAPPEWEQLRKRIS